MKINLFDKKIPSGIGLLLITIGIIVTTYLVKSGVFFDINAGPAQDPKNIEISNIDDSSFTLTYTTDGQVIGTINFGTSPKVLDKVVLDDRDQLTQSLNKYKIHSITARSLQANMAYYFTITSGDKQYLDKGRLFNTKTGSVIDKNPSMQEPMSGKAILPDGSIPTEGLVYVSIDGAQKLSAFLKNDGSYTVSLNNLRNAALDDYFNLDQNSIINIEINSENLSSSVSVSKDQISPVPIITLSNTYDFSTISDETSKATQKSNENAAFPTVGKVSKKIGLITPTPAQIEQSQTPTQISSPTPIPTISPTGNSSAIITTFTGFATFVSGIVTLLLSRGQSSL